MTFNSFSSIKDPKTLLKAFISTFTSEDFIVDIVRVTLYPSDFGSFTTDKSNSVIEYIKDFLKGLSNIVTRLQLPNSKTIQSQIQVVSTLLTIRESSASLLTYDNVFQHLMSKDLTTTKLIQKAVENQITSSDDFRKQTDTIINIIHSYYEIMSVSSTITLLDNLQDSIYENNLSPFEALKNYKDLIITAYNDLSKLQSLSKAESISDYFIISDEASCGSLAQTLVEYISRGYSVFKTGFDLFDKTLEGVESSSVHLLSAPSNHGKSIFEINLCYRMIKNNLADFDKNDCVLFVTLEDDIYKLSRRFASIFGNYRFDIIKKLFSKSYELTRATQIMGMSQDSSSKLISSLQGMFKNVLKTSITKVTGGNVTLILKHSNENEFSPGDLGRFIDRLRVEGYHVKMVFIDYLDVMTPTVNRFSNVKEYDTQGQIVQELRALSRIHKVPIVSPTQSRRDSENITRFMSNESVGDSYKKVRYTDFMYMCRMRPDKNFLSEEVRPHVIPKKSTAEGNALDIETLRIKDQLIDVLIPFEVKITKSKDSEKDQSKFLLFCKQNLRIYNNIDEYLKDAPIIKINSDKLEKDVMMLTDLAISSVSTDLMEHSNVIELSKFSEVESEGDIIFN